ncbi:MAG: ATP synthase F1 subunit gamma [Buchnera aphidicola (Kaburagia rhusicola ensigallis)]
MSDIREIRNKISCIKNTKKITKAMEMVSISKIKKAENQMNSGRPYLNTIQIIIDNIIGNNANYQHVYLENKEIKKIGIIIISTDRGLCGSLNTILFKKITKFILSYKNNNIISYLFILGSKGLSSFQSFSKNIIYHKSNLKYNYTFLNCLNCIHDLLKKYHENKLDGLFLSYNQFKNTFIQTPQIIQLLPLLKNNLNIKNNKNWDYIYESNSQHLLNVLLKNYIEFQIYQAILENYACEQVARMIAMKQATDNSKNLIKELQIIYNKARQDSITQELTEIVSGAAAVPLN